MVRHHCLLARDSKKQGAVTWLIRVRFKGGAIRIVSRVGSREAGTIIRLSCHVAADGIMIMPRIRRIRERKCER